MNAIKLTSIVLAGMTAVVAGATSASAFTFSVGGTAVTGEGFKSSVAGAKTVDFNAGSPSNNVVTYSGITNNLVQGSVSSQHATPFGNTSRYLTISNRNANVVGNTGSVTLNFAQALDYFGLYWGSVDTYNFIDFYSGGSLLRTFGGGDISTTARGSWTGASDNLYVNFFASAGQSFDRIVLRSNGTAFESDNHAYRESSSAAVPEPATMTGIALAGAGFAAVRRKKQKAQAS
ncbi:MAG: PEP-CTERM sorting domain-containing protein [Leptolyngbyaceae cyanobacterium bins.349]|nr:PEP-CTERM sorting domain-containing protein [Leptolyngbyaceae cyanobacterium bins.349]